MAGTVTGNDVFYPNYNIADWGHNLTLPDSYGVDKNLYKSLILEEIEKNAMLPYYLELCETFSWPVDQSLVQKLEITIAEELKVLKEKLEDAKENYGDAEIKEAQMATALFYCRIGNKEKMIQEYNDSVEKATGSGSKMDSLLALSRIALFYNDIPMLMKTISRSKTELEKGGDWERRNKLKVYEAVQLMFCRKFKEAAILLLDSISSFTASELLSFKSFTTYTVILSMLALDRTTLRDSVLASPEINQIFAEDPVLDGFFRSFYYCRYYEFMQHLIIIAERVQRDRYLGRHYRYFIRNIRLKAYSQYLEPFKSVTLSSIAQAFGVSSDFIEEEVSSFISSGKLSCEIDKVSKVITSNRSDPINSLYTQTIKDGDLLLNKIQKLSRVIDM